MGKEGGRIMGIKGTYETTLEEVLGRHGACDVVSFMFYAQPGIRDMAIINEGITTIYHGDFYINVTEIDSDLASTFGLTRGYKITFMFTTNIKELAMADWISSGFQELRVKFDLIEVKEVINDV